MSDVDAFRGKQVTIGKLVVEFPVEIPESDEDIVDREDTIAAIREEIAGPAEVVKFGKAVIKALHDDVGECMRQRRIEERTGVKQERFPLSEEKPRGKGRKAK